MIRCVFVPGTIAMISTSKVRLVESPVHSGVFRFSWPLLMWFVLDPVSRTHSYINKCCDVIKLAWRYLYSHESRIRAAFLAISPTSYFHSIYHFLFFCSTNDKISNTFRIHQFTWLIWLNCLSAKQEETTLQKTVRSESTLSLEILETDV